MERNLVVAAAVLDAAERWAPLEDVVALVEARVRETQPDAIIAAEDVKGVLDGLVASSNLLVDDDMSRWLRDRRSMVAARQRALGHAGGDGATLEALVIDGITPRDIAVLETAGMLERHDGGDGPRFTLSLKADDPLWQEGARAFLLRTLPPAEAVPTLTGIEAAVMGALAPADDWMSGDDIQTALNADQKADDHVALGSVAAAVQSLFNRELVDTRVDGETRLWREAERVVVARRAWLLNMLSFSVDGRDVDELAKTLGVNVAVTNADASALVEVGLVEVTEGKVRLARDRASYATALDSYLAGKTSGRDAEALAPGVVEEHIKEIAALRDKHGKEVRRADGLARWLRDHGIAEHDALDEVNGVVRKAAPKREEFEWTSARVVDAAEKGVILDEVLKKENDVAAVRLEADEAAGQFKSRIKGLEAEIRELKNSAACNQRVVSVKAYKVVDWERKRVVIRAADDHGFLAEEELPAGTQRQMPGTDHGEVAEPSANGETSAIETPPHGASPPDGAATEATPTDPGPLASEEARAAHRRRSSKRSARAQAAS